MAELKKCPFCGGEAKICDGSNEIVGSQYEIRCKNINCTIRPKTEWHESLEEATEHWNNRPTESEIRAKAHQEFYDKVLNFEDYVLPYAEDDGVQLYSGRDITRMIRQVANSLKEEQ